MRAGALYELVQFDAPKVEPDGSGGVESGWCHRVTERAKFRYLRGGESVQAARLQGRQPVVVTVRANARTRLITTDWRMRDARVQPDVDARTNRGIYNIRTVIETEDRRWLEITAETGVAI